MKEKWDMVRAELAKEEKCSRLDMVLALLVALLSGVLIGFLLCPRRQKTSYFGCNNGSNNGNFPQPEDEEEEDDVFGFCGDERCCSEGHDCNNEKRCCEDGPKEEPKEEDDEKVYVKIL